MVFLRYRRSPRLSVWCSPRRSSSLMPVVVVWCRHHRVIACRCLLAPCPSPRFAVPESRRRCSRFAHLCGRRAACRIVRRVGWRSRLMWCSLRTCLPCDGVVSPSSPFYPTRRAGRCCFGVPAAWVVLIGFSSACISGSALLAFLYMSAGRCLRYGCDGVRTGWADGCGLFSCLTG